MFNQVRIHPDDQVFHRFLWRTKESEQPRVYQWVRLNFGDKPAPNIAAAAIKSLAKASEAQYLEGAKELCTHVYVDDIGGSRENESRCKKVTSEIDAILSTAQFQVKTWHSNNKNVNQSDEERTDFIGHKWNKVLDKISFKKSEIVADLKNLSKRGCLASVAQMWDPMGLLAPCTIELRIDLQELWSAGYSWDEILPEEICTKWTRNIQILNQLLTYEFDRKLKPDNEVGLPEIHGFCDGSRRKGIRGRHGPQVEACERQLLLCPAHGEGVRCTTKEEIHSAIGINGMSYALQIIQYLQRSTRICRDN